MGGWQGYARPMLTDYADRLTAEIGSPPSRARAEDIVARLPITVHIEGPRLQYDSHPRRRWAEHFEDDDEERFSLTRRTADGHLIRFGLAEPDRPDRPRRWGWVTLALLLALTAAAYALVRRWLKPLDDIGAGAERYGQGDFSRPIAVRRDDELGDLAGRINRMADGLHGMLDAKRALLLAISHELRSPLTRARLNAELLPEGPEQQAVVRDLAVMRDLVTDLLESERLAGGHVVLQAEPTDLAALVREQLAAQPGNPPVALALETGLPQLHLDRVRIRLLLRNLVDNALRHGAGGPPPQVSLHRDADHLLLTVRDHGPGVSPEHLAHLAEAFYRPDSARTRAAGGVGLGLHLCQLVAQAHGGTLSVQNAQPGLAARVRLPITSKAA
ncbi:MAG: HAMP domain-containing histidine kinase [Rubrivivax sp.]|nr:HAMP domain-containing histidine kinase [Rubrivivax sp.]